MRKEIIQNKLVRDNIPQIIISQGNIPEISTLTKDEYRTELKKKLQEEVTEFLESEEQEEIADIMEVLDTIIDEYQYSREEIQNIKKVKKEKNGSFTKRIYLKNISMSN